MLWQGSQQAVDATIINPLTRTGAPQPGADAHPGRALDGAARRKRHHTYPELVRARRCRLGVGVGIRFSAEAATWLRLLAQHRASAAPAATRLGLGRLVVRLAGRPPPLERYTCGRPLAAWTTEARAKPGQGQKGGFCRCVQALRGGPLPSTQRVPEVPCRRCFRAGGFNQLLPRRGVKASHLQTRLCA